MGRLSRGTLGAGERARHDEAGAAGAGCRRMSRSALRMHYREAVVLLRTHGRKMGAEQLAVMTHELTHDHELTQALSMSHHEAAGAGCRRTRGRGARLLGAGGAGRWIGRRYWAESAVARA